MDRIFIRDLALRCIIGIFPEERREKQDIVINVAMGCDLRKAGRSDDLNDTVDYKAVKKAILKLIPPNLIKTSKMGLPNCSPNRSKIAQQLIPKLKPSGAFWSLLKHSRVF